MNNNTEILPAPEPASTISVESQSTEPRKFEEKDVQVSAPQHLPATTAATNEATEIKYMPQNSGQPLYEPLTGLNVDQMMHMVLSNVFVPPEVRYNTIIWEHWDVFSQAIYHWKVVRSNPSMVKLWGYSVTKPILPVCYVICPDKKSLLKIKFFKLGNLNVKTLTKHISIAEAVKECENLAVTRKHGCFEQSSRVFINTNTSLFDMIKEKDEEKLNKYIETELNPNYIHKFQSLGLDDKFIQNFMNHAKQQNIDYEYILQSALETLTDDIEADAADIKKIHRYYPYLDLLTKKELLELMNVINLHEEETHILKSLIK